MHARIDREETGFRVLVVREFGLWWCIAASAYDVLYD